MVSCGLGHRGFNSKSPCEEPLLQTHPPSLPASTMLTWQPNSSSSLGGTCALPAADPSSQSSLFHGISSHPPQIVPLLWILSNATLKWYSLYITP